MHNNMIKYRSLPGREAIALTDEMRVLALAAYGTHFHKLSAEGAIAMEQAISKDESWEVLLSNSHCFLAEDEGRIVGTAFLIPSGNPWRFFEADWAYIRMVGVLPEYEGRGIGRELTCMCIGRAQLLNEQTIALHTSEFMDAARHLYESLGFEKLKEIEAQWDRRYWIYTRTLP